MFVDTGVAPNPYVFAVGCPRSGTTLLQRMLDNHPALAVANDSHFIPLAVRNVPLDVDPPLTGELVDWVRSYRRFHRLGLADEQVARAARGAGTYAEFVAGLYTAYAAAHGKRLAGEKTPDYVKHLPRLHALFPAARFVHIVRDGRDVALSALEWARDGKGPSKLSLWASEPVAVCALWWRAMVGRGMEDGVDLGTAYRQISYERLVDDPEPVLRGVSRHLGLEYTDAMANFHVGRTRDNPRLSAKSAWLPAVPGLRDWQATMGERDLVLFELLAGDLLAELGYDLSDLPVTQEAAGVARRARDWWEARHVEKVLVSA